ncbi:DnaD domain protein [Bacillus aquiflavi]|uniref:DnaD domain protein n=1 Tax=Bacillus aquiflavi TaxID=2672567 RepID=A0A6B3W336_9BACI|nr:DnaD domain protein [Bacillus aquiflavi]MBA4538811.1 DnaD domain protein [Bacillus aquiflavi]NEY83165.1 DnaD domain protein [Bacillus aquiflavi]UAC49147.1 DnaD domain protein [Bacillus aquiflavi]
MSKLLLDDKPIIVLPILAKKIGLNEAIVLQQLHYWIKSSSHFYENRHWVYNTYEGWQKQFPFWSISTIRRAFSKLEKRGFLETGNFNKSSIDKTKWYSINYDMLEGVNKCSVQNEQSSEQNEHSHDQNEQVVCSKRTNNMLKVNRPIPEKTTENPAEITKVDKADARKQENPFAFFEENGFGMIGRYLSEKISNWCDDLTEELVLEAMKIAVEQGKMKWNYVEAILKDWTSKNIKTVQQVKTTQKAYKNKTQIRKRATPLRREQLPKWFIQEQTEQAQEQDVSDNEFEEQKRKLATMLKKYQK